MGVEVSGDLVTSILVVNNAGDGDAGSYSCTLPVFGNIDFPRAKANVHLIYGKINESSQHGLYLSFLYFVIYNIQDIQNLFFVCFMMNFNFSKFFLKLLEILFLRDEDFNSQVELCIKDSNEYPTQ